MAIISFKHQFVFIKTRKTAGTSIELELDNRVEESAIVTPIFPPESGHRPRNYKRGILRRSYYNHMPASLVRRYLGSRQYDEMYSFCVERHPISKCLSYYNMLVNSEYHARPENKGLSWATYCDRGDFPVDLEKYTEVASGSRRLIVSEVIAYESLRAEIDRISEQLGLDAIPLKANAKSSDVKAAAATTKDVTSTQRMKIMSAFEQSMRYAGLYDYYYSRDELPV